MWTVNYFFGGSFKKDYNHNCIKDHGIDMDYWQHDVTVTEFIDEGLYKVNTYHSKVVNELGYDLKPFIVAHDDTIEGFYNTDKKLIAVQFHMENKGVSNSLTKQIMKKFERL